MNGKKVYITPPPPKNNTPSGKADAGRDYAPLISSCTDLCKNYARFLYSYNNLLTEYQNIITYNCNMLRHCLTAYGQSHTAEQKKGEFTRYLAEHGFEPRIKEEDC